VIPINKIYCANCMDRFVELDDGSVDLVLTDIPYGEVNRHSNGLRMLNKKDADILAFDLYKFLEQIYRIASGTIIIFCGKEQISLIHSFFHNKQRNKLGTVRQLVWEKTNPSPMNGQHVFLSGIENAIWFKKSGAIFNVHCRNTVFRFPNGRNKLHPTEKNHLLLQELIEICSKPGDLVFDPCCGSGAHLLVAKQQGRRIIGFELSEAYAKIAQQRLRKQE